MHMLIHRAVTVRKMFMSAIMQGADGAPNIFLATFATNNRIHDIFAEAKFIIEDTSPFPAGAISIERSLQGIAKRFSFVRESHIQTLLTKTTCDLSIEGVVHVGKFKINVIVLCETFGISVGASVVR